MNLIQIKSEIARIDHFWVWGSVIRKYYFDNNGNNRHQYHLEWALDIHDHADWWVIALRNLGQNIREIGIASLAAKKGII